MSLRPGARALAVACTAAIAIGVLSGCDPVAWARKTQVERAQESGTAAPGATASVPETTADDRLCAGDTDAPAVSTRDEPGIGYAALPRRSTFTGTVASAGDAVVLAGATRFAFDDFGSRTAGVAAKDATMDGAVIGPNALGLVGAGAGKTLLEVAEDTSTRADAIPTTFPQTNQLDVVRVTGATAVLRGFTVRGTDQGHLYNGLRIDQVRGLRADHLQVVGIPGDDAKPPGETFGINDYRTVGSVWDHVEVDGDGVGASGFGVNGSRNIRICDTVSHGNRYSMGFAFWQTNGIRLVDCSADDNGFSGFNFERVSGTTTLIRPRASGNRYAMRIATDRVSGKYVIVDPQLTDGRFTVTLPNRWYGRTNKQRVSDITLMIDGRERPDLLRIERY